MASAERYPLPENESRGRRATPLLAGRSNRDRRLPTNLHRATPPRKLGIIWKHYVENYFARLATRVRLQSGDSLPDAEGIFGRFDPSLVRETSADYVAFGNGLQVPEPVDAVAGSYRAAAAAAG